MLPERERLNFRGSPADDPDELTAIPRIRRMEACFDALRAPDARERADFHTLLDELLQYYEGGMWLSDYELDERGLLPRDLKRGVLSEDGVYDLLTERNGPLQP